MQTRTVNSDSPKPISVSRYSVERCSKIKKQLLRAANTLSLPRPGLFVRAPFLPQFSS